MKSLLILTALAAMALGRPQGPGKDAQILRYENENNINGYKFAFETSDGISREEQGELKNAGSENEAMTIHGTFTWKDLDGKVYTITFVADENGYRPEGAHLGH